MRIDLKNFRQSHGLFQSQMAEILQINQSNVSRAELKGYLELNYNQQKTLEERFGKENVESFAIQENAVTTNMSVVATGNQNIGDGTQNNGIFSVDAATMNIIRQQSDALVRLADMQASQTDRLIALLEKISEKL